MRRFLHRLEDCFLPTERNACRPYILKKQSLLFFLTMVLTAEGLLVASHVLKTTGVEFLAAVIPGEIIAFTNIERSDAHLEGVRQSPELTRAAEAKAEDMARIGYFSHVGPDGKEPWEWIQESGYEYAYAGENLAVRFAESSDVVEAWMASPTHRANIIKPVYTDIGVGVVEGLYEGKHATYVVQYFGTPRVAVATPAPQPVAAPPPATVAGIPIGQPAVQGIAAPSASVEVLPAAAEGQVSFQTYLRALLEGIMRSDETVLWVIGGIAGLLVVALALAFFIHLQVQPTDMLMGGATVAAVAISLLYMNTLYVSDQSRWEAQSASVINGLVEEGIIEEGFSIEALPS